MISSDESVDALFSGRLVLSQSRTGYRFSLDALLLAHFVTVKPHWRIIDLGTGSGVIPLVLADLYPSIKLTGVELQPKMVERAYRNVRRNGLQSRIQILRGDVRDFQQIASGASFDGAVCNPPYRRRTSGRLSIDPERQIARHEIAGGLDDFLRAAAFLLRAKGSLAMVYPALRCADLLTALRKTRIEPKRLRMVHSFLGSEASLVLVEAFKEGRAGVKVLPPLVVYRSSKKYSDEILRIVAGSRERLWRLGTEGQPDEKTAAR